jgi:hypothetical protein
VANTVSAVYVGNAGALVFGNGRQLTSLSASAIDEGALANPRLPTNVSVSGTLTSNGVFSTGSTFSLGGNITIAGQPGFGAGNGDGASYATYNTFVGSWWGLGVRCAYDSTVRHVFDTRNGNLAMTGTCAAAAFSGSGAGLTSLAADQVTTGQLNNARLPTNVNVGGTFRANGAVTVQGGSVSAAAGISFVNTDPGVLIEKRYAAHDRFGLGQYVGVTRLYAGNLSAAGGGSTVRVCFPNGEDSWLDALTVNTRGNVGIGTTAPAYQLQLSTDSAAKPTSSTWTIASDRRVKTDVQDANLQTCYDAVKALRLRRFAYDANAFPDVRDRNVVGWIAQEVANVLPKAVTPTDQHGLPDFLGLDVDQIYKTMYGALQKVVADVESLAARVESLAARVESLAARVESPAAAGN